MSLPTIKIANFEETLIALSQRIEFQKYLNQLFEQSLVVEFHFESLFKLRLFFTRGIWYLQSVLMDLANLGCLFEFLSFGFACLFQIILNLKFHLKIIIISLQCLSLFPQYVVKQQFQSHLKRTRTLTLYTHSYLQFSFEEWLSLNSKLFFKVHLSKTSNQLCLQATVSKMLHFSKEKNQSSQTKIFRGNQIYWGEFQRWLSKTKRYGIFW